MGVIPPQVESVSVCGGLSSVVERYLGVLKNSSRLGLREAGLLPFQRPVLFGTLGAFSSLIGGQ